MPRNILLLHAKTINAMRHVLKWQTNDWCISSFLLYSSYCNYDLPKDIMSRFVPTCLKATIVPVPNKSTVSSLSDFWGSPSHSYPSSWSASRGLVQLLLYLETVRILRDLRLSGTASPAPRTQVPHRASCLVHCCSLCWLMTVQKCTDQTTSSNSQITQPWWVWSAKTMSWHTERRCVG